MTPLEREQIILKNRGLVNVIVTKALRIARVHRCFGTFDDAFQCGMMALCNAVDTYDVTRGNAFGTYAGRVIWNALINGSCDIALIRVPPYNLHASSELSEKLQNQTDSAMKVGKLNYSKVFDNNLSEPIDRLEREDVRFVLRKQLEGMWSKRHREIIAKIYGIGHETVLMKDIAKQEGLSWERIRQLKDEGLQMLRIRLRDMKECFV